MTVGSGSDNYNEHDFHNWLIKEPFFLGDFKQHKNPIVLTPLICDSSFVSEMGGPLTELEEKKKD